MAETETELRNGDPEEWEKRTLNLIKGSEIDQEFSALKSKAIGRKNRHKIKKMSKPMVLPGTLLEFIDDDLREAAIRYLSTFLIEVIVDSQGALSRSRQPEDTMIYAPMDRRSPPSVAISISWTFLLPRSHASDTMKNKVELTVSAVKISLNFLGPQASALGDPESVSTPIDSGE